MCPVDYASSDVVNGIAVAMIGTSHSLCGQAVRCGE